MPPILTEQQIRQIQEDYLANYLKEIGVTNLAFFAELENWRQLFIQVVNQAEKADQFEKRKELYKKEAKRLKTENEKVQANNDNLNEKLLLSLNRDKDKQKELEKRGLRIAHLQEQLGQQTINYENLQRRYDELGTERDDLLANIAYLNNVIDELEAQAGKSIVDIEKLNRLNQKLRLEKQRLTR